MARLNPKQKRFCEEYIVDLNATQAAIRAGYSERTAGSQAHDLLKKPEIQTYIAKLQEAIATHSDHRRPGTRRASGDRVLNVADVVEADRNGIVITNLDELPLTVQAAIAEVSSFSRESAEGNITTSTKIKMHDKLGALRPLAQHLGITSDFNVAVHTLAKYGLHLKRDDEGGWHVSTTAPTSTDG